MTPDASPPTRILVADDEADIRSVVKALLRRANIPGLEVVTCASAEEGLSLLRATRFDVLIADHHMERLTGTDLLEEARLRFPGTGRIMITGFAEEDIAVDAINRAQVHAYVRKPWTAESFIQTVRRVMADAQRMAAFESALERGQVVVPRPSLYPHEAGTVAET